MEHLLTKINYINSLLNLPENEQFTIEIKQKETVLYRANFTYINQSLDLKTTNLILDVIIKTLQLCRYVKTLKGE
jgi:hypothetical protein